MDDNSEEENAAENDATQICRTMCLKEFVFADLLELYPETAKNIKLRGLEKRDVIIYYLQKAKANFINPYVLEEE